jgi:peptidoglycan/xylan/chitin deacetylase (PgdA/CDA1 family)
MVEALILLGVQLAMIGGGVAAWRIARGPAQRRTRMAGRAAAVSMLAIPLVTGGAWMLMRSRTIQIFGQIVANVDTSEPVVALTFDDGPTAEYTDQVLFFLGEEGVRATFFVTGRELEENPDAGRRIVAAGHELGNHSYSHKRMVLRPYCQIRQEIEKTDLLIRASGYQGEIHFRSPFGKKLLLLPYYLGRTGRKNIFWDVEPESYPEIASDAGRIVEHVLEKTEPGSIILLHVMYGGRAESREALPGIIEGLRARGTHFVTVSELLATQ